MQHKQNKRRVPMTDGTPAPCRQKNAASFLKGETPGVMASYGPGEREPGGPIPTLKAPPSHKKGGRGLFLARGVNFFKSFAPACCNPGPVALL